jgi:O-6-methylguanine DNA methyltransferase
VIPAREAGVDAAQRPLVGWATSFALVGVRAVTTGKVYEARLLLIGGELDRAVWEALLSIPAGSFTSYGALAEKLGKPKAARAIGGAVGRNPVCVAVPCHRVRGKDGAPTGYHWGLSTKQALLEWENKHNIL